MEVTGVVFRQSPGFSSAAADVSSSRRLRCFTTVKKFNRVAAVVGGGEFRDKSHVKYYEGVRMEVKERDEKKEMKKKLKLLKGLSKNLNAFNEMGFGLGLDDDGLGQQVKGKMISEATEVLLGQLQKLKEEKMEYKRMKKEEKAKKKASRMTMTMTNKTECKDSSSSESSSSESDCDNVVNMSQLKTVEAANSNTLQEATVSVQILEKPENRVVETAICKVGSSVVEADCGKKIEVCMGGKCKKSGAAMLLENFQAAVGGEATVVSCKCMGKCRDGPNVMVRSEEVASPPTNSLCIGVGLEDVDSIVTNFFGGSRVSGSDMMPALS